MTAHLSSLGLDLLPIVEGQQLAPSWLAHVDIDGVVWEIGRLANGKLARQKTVARGSLACGAGQGDAQAPKAGH